MSLATRCPECSTTFQVVPDQLRISDGWVRCGRCSRVFDANDHMVDPSQPIVTSTVTAEVAPEDDDLPWSDASASSPSWQGLPSLDLGGAPDAGRIDPIGLPVDKVDAAIPAAQDVTPGEENAPFIVRTPSEPSSAHAAHGRLDPRAGESDFSFLGAVADSAAERRRRVGRTVALVVLAVVAAIVLLAQVIAQSHDALVARQPALRPAVLAWCRLAGCKVSPLRKIDDIAIDGSAFARQKGEDGYLLTFTLRNRSDLPLAMPSVELSLLDTQERPVVRRVLRPSDFGAPVVLSARGEHSAALPLALASSQVEALQPLIVGYHLDPFYP